MKEEEIRKKYQREDDTDLRGVNIGAVDKFIEMLHLQEENKDLRISSIARNFEYMGELAPNFTIFQNEKCLFMRNFKAYQISERTNMLVASHEFGHAVLSIMNKTEIPENYEDLIKRAKQHAISPENKEYFKEYIQYLCRKTQEAERRTEAEKGPVSDIISSVFQFQGLRIGSEDNICILPSSHSRNYYYDEEKGKLNLKNIFDENFANYYALKTNNCTQELETVRALFGDEFLQTLDEELEKAYLKLEKVKENRNQGKTKEDAVESIKSVIMFSRQGEIDNINSLEQIAQMENRDAKESESEINE